jgi:hypothetical protein
MVQRTIPPARVSATADGLVLKVEHISRFPDRTAPWLYQRLGHGAAVAFRALSRAVEEAETAGA